MKPVMWGVVAMVLVPSLAFGQRYVGPDGKVRVALVKMPYNGERNVAEISEGPDYLEQGGLAKRLQDLGITLGPVATARLTTEQSKDYGAWHRVGLANGHLAELVAANEKQGYLSVGLLANCSSLMGMLAGFQQAGSGRRPLKIALVWIDAHADFNTPETTLSGMLGGMPVAISAGHCLTNLRLKARLDPALPTRYIVMAGVRDTDPLEQERLDRSDIVQLTVDDLRTRSARMHAEMERLSGLTDLIYVHVDMDVLDPREVAGHSLSVSGGPTSAELGAALTDMFKYEKVAGLGIASTPSGARDKDGLSRAAAYALIMGAVKGVQGR